MKTNWTGRLGRKIWAALPLFSLALMLVLTGCIASVYPLYHEKNITFDPALIGAWGENEKEQWTFSKRDEKSYDLLISDNEKPARMICRLVKIENRLFLDLSANPKTFEEAKLDPWTASSLVPGHIILKVESINPLKMGLLKRDWLEEQITKDSKFITHVLSEDKKDFFLAATTDELQHFVIKHWATAAAWEMTEMKQQRR